MKKIVSTLLVASAVASSIFAKEVVTDVHIGGASSKVLDKDSTEYNIGYGVTSYSDNNIYFGISFDLSYGEIELINKNLNVYSYSADGKLGYAFFDKKLGAYGIVSGMYQSIDSLNGAGFGYGAGLDYRITDHIAINLEYKTYDMKSDKMPDYTHEKVISNIKFTF
jgi:opacity protein-like surface antigen